LFLAPRGKAANGKETALKSGEKRRTPKTAKKKRWARVKKRRNMTRKRRNGAKNATRRKKENVKERGETPVRRGVERAFLASATDV
jgi:hypothetical protein